MDVAQRKQVQSPRFFVETYAARQLPDLTRLRPFVQHIPYKWG